MWSTLHVCQFTVCQIDCALDCTCIKLYMRYLVVWNLVARQTESVKKLSFLGKPSVGFDAHLSVLTHLYAHKRGVAGVRSRFSRRSQGHIYNIGCTNEGSAGEEITLTREGWKMARERKRRAEENRNARTTWKGSGGWLGTGERNTQKEENWRGKEGRKEGERRGLRMSERQCRNCGMRKEE